MDERLELVRKDPLLPWFQLENARRIKQLERKIGKEFEAKTIPSGKEICGKQLFKLVEDLKQVEVDKSEFEQYLPAITAELEGFLKRRID